MWNGKAEDGNERVRVRVKRITAKERKKRHEGRKAGRKGTDK